MDIPAFGSFLLSAALVAASYAFFVSVRAHREVLAGRMALLRSARFATWSTCALVTVTVCLLAYAFQTHDFRITYVSRYSDRSMSTGYLLAALWGGQDGSLLWWTFLLCGWTSACLLWLKSRYQEYQPVLFATLMSIVLFFLVLQLFAANPFKVNPAATPVDGEGLNPLLQNYWMAIHPPTLYMGFVGWAVPFAFAVSALVTGRLGDEWLRIVRPWVLAVWLFLSVGLVLGMVWSYEELGWGGYWAWDPVENASFFPWLAGTAFLHSVMVQGMRALLPLTASFALPAVAGALQSPRPEIQLSPAPSFAVEPAVASAGDLTAAVWFEGLSGEMLVATSDGRGLAWSAPVRIDSDTLGASKAPEVWSIHVVGASVYVGWRDERFGNSNDELYFNRSLDGGATWQGEVRIDKGFAAGVGGVRDWRMAVAPGASGAPDHIYFLMAADPTVNADESLYFAASTDGGASFSSAATPSSIALGTADVDDVSLFAEGGSVFAAWRDNRFGDDETFLQRSDDGGASWLGADLVLSDPLDAWDGDDEVEVAAAGSTVAVAYQEDTACCNFEELRITVSTDGGLSWGAPVKVGGYATSTDDADMTPGALAVLENGNVVVAWTDDRASAVPDENEVYTSTSSDGGLSWSADVQLSAGTGGAPKISASGERVALVWSEGTTVDDVGTAFSPDGGASWNPTFYLPKPAGEDIDDPHVAYNALYGNFLCVYLAGNLFNEVFAGGFRPQTLVPVGWTGGATALSFGFEDFQTDVPVAWGLVSLSTGSLPIPFDGRDLGLASDAIFNATLNLALQGVFAAPLGPGGDGQTAPLPTTLPPGLTLQAVGLGVDLGAVHFGDITDPVEIAL